MGSELDSGRQKENAENKSSESHISKLNTRQKAYQRARDAYDAAKRLSRRLRQTAGCLARSEWITVILTAVITAATVWNVVVVRSSLGILQGQLEAMRQANASSDQNTTATLTQMQAQSAALQAEVIELKRQGQILETVNRARIILHGFKQIPVKDPNNFSTVGWMIEPTVENVGNTPAVDWRSWVQLYYVPSSQWDIFNPQEPIDPRPPKSAPLAPREPEDLHDLHLATSDIILAAKNGMLPVICFWIHYREVYNIGIPRQLRMCTAFRLIEDVQTGPTPFLPSRFGAADYSD